MDNKVRALMEAYPKIYFACHTRHVRDQSTGAELSAHQASILDHLDTVEPTGVSELADHMGVTASTMSLALDRLAVQGYVERRRDVHDGRRVHLRLTPAGARMKSASSVLDAERVAEMLSELSARDRATALRGLRLLAEAANRSMVRRGPDATYRARMSQAECSRNPGR